MKKLLSLLFLCTITGYAAQPAQRAVPIQIIVDESRILNLYGQPHERIADFIDAVEKEYGIIIEQVRINIPSQSLNLRFNRNSRERFSNLSHGSTLIMIASKLPSTQE